MITNPTFSKNIAILGSTGSIGRQMLEVIRMHPEHFRAEVITAHSNTDLLIQQAIEFKPNAVVIGDESKYKIVKDALVPLDIKVFAGEASLEQVVEFESIDVVLTAMVGFAGLKSTLRAINASKTIALANKETLVVAGELITSLANEKKVNIFPVDSEHSAIFQCLVGEFPNPIEKIILTASGGPFRGMSLDQLQKVTKEDALRHPNWNMGNKITIDSATLMNKGLEVIEAKWLFGLKPEQIDVVVHPQSIIHSIVQFCDGSMKSQMSLPDMRMPIQYALSYPHRITSSLPRFNFADCPSLTFEAPDRKIFRNLTLAYDALNKGGNMPCIMNAANEIAVEAFLKERIYFVQIPDVIEKCMHSLSFVNKPSLDEYIQSDKESREKALDYISKIH